MAWMSKFFLRFGSPELRRRTAERLAAQGKLDLLFAEAHQSSESRRRVALEALSNARGGVPSDAHERLLGVLRESPRLASETTSALDRLSPDWRSSAAAKSVATSFWQRLKEHPDDDVTASALAALGSASNEILLDFVASISSWSYRRDAFVRATGLLAAVGDQRAIEHLVKRLGDEQAKPQILQALTRIDPEWRHLDSQRAGGFKALVEEEEFDLLVEMGFDWRSPAAEAAVPVLIRKLVPGKDYPLPGLTLDLLARIDPQWTLREEAREIVPGLVEALYRSDSLARSTIHDDLEEVLRNIPSPDKVPLILASIREPPHGHGRLRSALGSLDAADASWRRHPVADEVLEGCVARWREEKSLWTESVIFDTVALIKAIDPDGDPTREITSYYVRSLSSDQAEERLRAARLFVQDPDPEAREALARALRDSSAEVRQQALRALAKLGDPLALDAHRVVVVEGTASRWTLLESVAALGELGDESDLELLLKPEFVGWEGTTGVQAVTRLVERCSARLTGDQLRTILEVSFSQKKGDFYCPETPADEGRFEEIDNKRLGELVRTELAAREG